jgi:GNAT superfamily N-acetyltransferase
VFQESPQSSQNAIDLSRHLSVFERWVIDRDAARQEHFDSLKVWTVPNLQGVGRLFVAADASIRTDQLDALADRCSRGSLVLTSSHSELLTLARKLGIETYVFRWADCALDVGSALVRWAEPLEGTAIHCLHKKWRGDQPDGVDAWAVSNDCEGNIIGIAATAAEARVVGFAAAVVVDPNSRRRGIGASLSAFVLNYQLSKYPLVGLIHRSSNAPARTLYDKLKLNSVDFVMFDAPSLEAAHKMM